MNEKQQNNIKQFLACIGYQFRDNTLLPLALTHRSAGNQNNERLEFLGDSILNFVIGASLFKQYPKANEGQLTRMRSQLVRGETLAIVAQGFDLGKVMVLGPGEVRTGGHQRRSILADGLEAVIGAIYLDSDLATVQKIILQWFDKSLQTADVDSLAKDPKTRLQELLQSKGLSTPEYQVVKISGPQHNQHFVVECQVELLEQAVQGEGISRRKAEQAAALAILSLLGENS